MKILVVGDINDGCFNYETFSHCMREIVEDKDDHCGKRSVVNGTSIKSVITVGGFYPFEVMRWANNREINVSKFKGGVDFFSSFAVGMDHLEAGDAIVAFFEDEADERLKGVELSAKRLRRKVYRFLLTKEYGWALVKATVKPKPQSLF